jgi:hypothetical protein
MPTEVEPYFDERVTDLGWIEGEEGIGNMILDDEFI